MAEPPAVQRVARATFLAGEAECAVCGAWVREDSGADKPLAKAPNAAAAHCGVCGVMRYFELI